MAAAIRSYDDTASTTMPRLLECYSEEFNPHTGRGGMEIWLPIDGR